MKIIVDDCENEDPRVMLYNPQHATYALAYADAKGWDPERRWASEFMPLGEIWYTQEVGLNRIFDHHLDESSFAMEEAMDEFLP